MSIVALAVSVAFVSGVMAESKPAPQETTAQEAKLEKFSGVVEKVDEATKDVLVEFHKEKMTFSLDDHTKIMEGKKLIADSLNISMPKVEAKQVTPSEVKKGNSSEKTTGNQVVGKTISYHRAKTGVAPSYFS